MWHDTSIYLNYEDQCEIIGETIRSDIRYFLSDYALEDELYRYQMVDILLDAHGFYANEDEHFEFVTEVGGAFVNLQKKVRGYG